MVTGIIIFDFDGTITTVDTINTLASLPTSHHPSEKTKRHEKLWEEIVEGYVADHTEHTKGYAPDAESRRTLEQELGYLESLRVPEGASIQKVSQGSLFAGLKEEDFRGFGERIVDDGTGDHAQGGERVRLRKGFGEFVEKCGKQGWEIGVVSVNWSRDFIKGVIAKKCAGQEVRVVANGIRHPEGRIEGPEELGGEVMMTAGDKLRGMELLSREGDEKKKVVYFGDSTTDLACLVEAELGVVVADEEEGKLLVTSRRIGFGVPHVGEYREAKDGKRQGMVWARDFEEVMESRVVEGLQR
ncbi:HAD-like domain-containing protein [Triangularia verruculosa]|uniref:HAD-like domain-containing protein n=1 Tax=Triangularia verruculosa TaxID=2587418 RepID=A0AAN7ANY3_9PEZI|nr:HAD-like domain-containing protein [Triangularia verruculosa]